MAADAPAVKAQDTVTIRAIVHPEGRVTVLAQEQQKPATVSGTVRDSQGGVMPGVLVALSNDASGTQSTTSDRTASSYSERGARPVSVHGEPARLQSRHRRCWTSRLVRSYSTIGHSRLASSPKRHRECRPVGQRFFEAKPCPHSRSARALQPRGSSRRFAMFAARNRRSLPRGCRCA